MSQATVAPLPEFGDWAAIDLFDVFEHDDELWTRANRGVADAAWRSALHIKHAPPDARLN